LVIRLADHVSVQRINTQVFGRVVSMYKQSPNSETFIGIEILRFMQQSLLGNELIASGFEEEFYLDDVQGITQITRSTEPEKIPMGLFYRYFKTSDGFLILSLRHPHFCDIIKDSAISNPNTLPLVKLALEEYLDDFNALSKMHRPVGGSYGSLCNYDYDFRQSYASIFTFGYIPPDIYWKDFYVEILKQINELEKGMEVEVAGEKVLVAAGIAVGTHDMVQGNQKAGTKSQKAYRCCRHCDIQMYHLCELTIGKKRTHSQMVDERKNIQKIAGKTAREEKETETGILQESTPFEKISFDISRQLPHDVEHSESGLACALLEAFLEILSAHGIALLDSHLTARGKDFYITSKWKDLNFYKVKNLVKILPNVLRIALEPAFKGNKTT